MPSFGRTRRRRTCRTASGRLGGDRPPAIFAGHTFPGQVEPHVHTCTRSVVSDLTVAPANRKKKPPQYPVTPVRWIGRDAAAGPTFSRESSSCAGSRTSSTLFNQTMNRPTCPGALINLCDVDTSPRFTAAAWRRGFFFLRKPAYIQQGRRTEQVQRTHTGTDRRNQTRATATQLNLHTTHHHPLPLATPAEKRKMGAPQPWTEEHLDAFKEQELSAVERRSMRR